MTFNDNWFAYDFKMFPPSQQEIIGVLFAKQDSRCGGHIYYQVYYDSDTLDMLSTEIHTYTPSDSFQASMGIVITWENMKPWPCDLIEDIYGSMDVRFLQIKYLPRLHATIQT